MNRIKNIALLCIFSLFPLGANSQTFDITKYGAVGDGVTLNTDAIQKTIDACYLDGGGTVIVPAGVFIIGTVYLKSNIHLYLEAGAILRGSPILEDYAPYPPVHYGMLYAQNAENITISGAGNIDGNGDRFFDLTRAKKIEWGGTRYTRQKENFRKVADGGVGDGPIVPKERPYQMFIFSHCRRVTVQDIFISNAPFWTMHFADCDGVKVEGIRLWTNMLAPNADGIDVTSCNHVIITGCDIRSGDDGIAITGYDHHYEVPGFIRQRHPSGNIIVSNCTIQSCSSGIRIGSLDQNAVRNIQVSNCNITNSTRGIGIFLRDEGSLENIMVSNCIIEAKLRTGDWWGNGEPIHISAIRGKDSVPLGRITNVKFDHIICTGENGILVFGTDESIIENVTFNDVTLELVDSKLNDVAGGNIDLRNCTDERLQLFQRDLPAFLAQYVSELTIENFRLEWENTRMPYFTHGIEVNHFTDLKIKDFKGSASPINASAFPVYIKDGKGLEIDRNIRYKKINVRNH